MPDTPPTAPALPAETLAGLAGALLSLLLAYLPGLAPRFAALDGTRKRLALLVALALCSLGAWLLACQTHLGPALGLPLACGDPLETAAGLLRSFLLALAANQSTYALLPARPVRAPG